MYNLLHTGIVVKDMDKSIEFYTKVLNFQVGVKHEDQHVKLVMLKGQNQGVELLQFPLETKERKEGLINHIAFAVDDMEKEIARLKELGIPLLTEEPREVMGGMKIFFFQGPSGESIEFVQEPKRG